ncbi:MAG: DoxX family protein [Methylotenera sp.]|nr:DoxX family protein [Methylotenera sp.]
MNATQSITSFIGRILLSIIFIISGFGKLANHSGTVDYINSVGAPLPEVAYWIALFAEIGLGLGLFVGFKARFAAIGLAGFTLAATLLFHSNFSDQIQMIMFMKNLTIIGGLLLVVAYGAGAFSLDNRQ